MIEPKTREADSISDRAHARSRKRREWKEPVWLMPLLDIALAFLAFGLAYVVRYELQIIRPVGEAFRAPFSPYIPFAVVYILWLDLIYRGSGLYKVVRGRAWLDEVYTIINGVIYANLRERGIGVQRVLVIGAGETGGAVLRTMFARKDQGYVPVGYLDQDPNQASADLGRVKGLGGIDNLRNVLREEDVD